MQWTRTGMVIGALVVAAGAAYAVWLAGAADEVPDGFAMSNGRIEAETVDVATKFSGRLRHVFVQEGDMVEAGQVLAQLDTAELEAQLAEAKAAVAQAEQQKGQAEALLVQRKSELELAEIEYQRSTTLAEGGFTPVEQVDQRRTVLATAKAAISAADAQIALAEAGINAAQARVHRLRTDLQDLSLEAPRDGRVQYRLAEPGEVLAAGGKVLTLVDLTDVYMTIFLPARDAGRLAVGSEARLVLNPIPEYRVPARVSFVASEAQFTPRAVETAEERDKLMFRVKLTIAPDLLQQYQQQAKAGVRGVGYVQVDPNIAWPDDLAVNLPE